MILKTAAAELYEFDRRILFQGAPTKAPSIRSKRAAKPAYRATAAVRQP